MIVVDASVIATALIGVGGAGEPTRARLRGEVLTAPHLIDVEVLSVLRRQVLGGQLAAARAEEAVADLLELPLKREPHLPLLARCWALRDNLGAYDACYVALAESLETVLLTADTKLSRAPGLRCVVELLQPPDPSTVPSP